MKKNGLLVVLMVLALLVVGCQSSQSTLDVSKEAAPISLEAEDDLDEAVPAIKQAVLLEHMISGGPPPDGIPPIDKPIFESIESADLWLNPYDRIFVYETHEKVYLLPQRIMVWHEIVNMSDEGLKTAITYCPLTGSAIGYFYPEGQETSFGTSGSLINSNLLMYDRLTNAYISQIDGQGLNLDLEGVVLDVAPVFWTDWEHAKKAYPQAIVLTRDTGVFRDYDTDPYGSYEDIVSNNYYHNEGVIFPLIHTDPESVFKAKYPVIGVKMNGHYLALDLVLVQEREQLTFELGQVSLTALYDPSIGAARLFITPPDQALTLTNGMIQGLNDQTWTLTGQSLGRHASLDTPRYFEVMWFAWFAFYPETDVLR